MIRRKMFGFALLSATLGFIVSIPAVFAQPAQVAAPIHIGLVNAFFNDVPPTLIDIAVEPFGIMMKQTTGFEGKLSHKDDAFEVARKLNDNHLQIGVFHGHEFAWMQQKYPKLTPLMVAVNQYRDVRAFVIVHKNNPARSIADLRGKAFDMPEGTKEHCRICLGKHCTDNATRDPKAFFKTIEKSKSSIAALDNVFRGKMEAVLVDTIALEFYKEIKGAAFFQYNLRVLQQSESFPAPVIVYKEGMLDNVTLKKFRDGLANAHKTPDGQDMMKMWQIDRFEDCPKNYPQQLATTLKAYPAP